MSAGIAIRTATIALAAVGGPAYIVAAGVAVALGVGAKAYCDHKAGQKRLQQQNRLSRRRYEDDDDVLKHSYYKRFR